MDFVNGVSASIIVYGQTGSGKTHTMFGDEHAPSAGVAPLGWNLNAATAATLEKAGEDFVRITGNPPPPVGASCQPPIPASFAAFFPY